MNILLMTNTMKQPDDTFAGRTDVVFYFAKAWAKDGHKVVVIHNESKFPIAFYHLPKFVYSYLQKKGNVAIPSPSSRNRMEREEEGIKILRIPMSKCIPHASYRDSQYIQQIALIREYLSKINFVPDVITGHWLEPQLRLVSELGKVYNAKTGFVFHGDLPQTLSTQYQKYISKLNCLFFRSDASKRKAMTGYLKDFMPSKVSVCYSGIPEKYIENCCLRDDWKKDGTFRVVFVGRLVRYKRIESIIQALNLSFPNGGYSFDVIGEGTERDNLESLCKELHVEKMVKFHGRLSRDQVQENLREADCFTMISENEVFGLVYLEAMASGCLTIASRDGGVDGIIVNSKNGFLCEQGNMVELSKILSKVSALEKSEVMRVRYKALKTVSDYSDNRVAQRYLTDICGV